MELHNLLSSLLLRRFFVVGPILEANRDPPRDARFLHSDAVQHVGAGHRPLRVRDENELRLIEKILQHRGEAADVRLVQSRIHLVEDAERTRLAAEDGQEQGNRRHRFFAAGHERDAAQLLAGRASNYLKEVCAACEAGDKSAAQRALRQAIVELETARAGLQVGME